jgi:phosphohistidine phosphatase
MNLYFLRHGSAGNRRANPLVDAKRPLDKEGLRQCWLIAQYINALDLQFDAVLSSPLKRALQTASRVANEIGHDARITITKALTPSATVKDFQRLLGDYSQMDNVMVVGHNPNLAQFLSATVGANGTRPAIRLRKGSLARVDMSQRPPTLQWLVAPTPLDRFYVSAGKSSRRKTSRK